MARVVRYVTEDGTDYFDERLQNQDSDIEMAQSCWKAYQQEKKKCP
ncbi:MAG: hypothetical protein OXH92_01425 [Bryobacterales bacterium]|nr:hypothetical protein [Bryobacterales bacterium]MDE0296306.1 hypothetical protein [Bryobacterales bacterium]MDE0432645.1 hypothetical protein [Bryobacterales bacterium]